MSPPVDNKNEPDHVGFSGPVDLVVLTIPCIDMRHTLLSLPLPTKQNSGGFRLAHKDNPQYSPVDLTIAGMYSIKYNKIIRNLRDFFTNPVTSDRWLINNNVYISCLVQGDIISLSINEWKQSTHVSGLIPFAPFTFKF